MPRIIRNKEPDAVKRGRGRPAHDVGADDPAVEACRRAIAAAGGPGKLARLMGDISYVAVRRWQIVPAERVLHVERLTGVSRFELRPDVYGDDVDVVTPTRTLQLSARVAIRMNELSRAVRIKLSDMADMREIPPALRSKIEHHAHKQASAAA